MSPSPAPAAIERSPADGSDELFIFFGGIKAGIAMPPFEFYRSAEILDAGKLFLRDFAQCWYHAGLAGETTGLRDTAALVDGEIAAAGASRATFVGNSMGGFAALLFACLSESDAATRAVAFAPQTFISPRLRRKHGDARWPEEIEAARRRSRFRRKAWDLAPVLRRADGRVEAAVFASEDDPLDALHARRLEGLPGVSVTLLPGGGHGVVKHLRDAGELPAILRGRAK